MKKNIYGFGVISILIIAALCACNSFAELTATAMPKTVQDTTFPQRNELKQTGYGPYKDASAYEIPNFIETDDDFKKAMCDRDHDECCRRWPDYKGCQPQIIYELFGGNKSNCEDKVDPSKGSGPNIYYTNRGATITCIPTRGGNSQFTGWCPTPDRTKCGTSDCPMMQNIPVGEKDDKHFWACWKCLPPATQKGDQCECPDPNMDDSCQCTRPGMIADPSNPNKCICRAAGVAHIDSATHQCVCNDPNMDINTDCTTRRTPCTDPHMDPNTCECLPIGSKDLAGVCTCVDNSDVADPNQQIVGATPGTCECKDPTVMEKDLGTGRCECNNGEDITTNPTCEPREYVFLQCRADIRDVNAFITNYRTTHLSESLIPGSGYLNCESGHDDDIDKCFTPCDAVPIYYPAQINTELASASEPFCSGNKGSSSHTVWFTEPGTRDKVLYTKANIDLVFTTLGTRSRAATCKAYGYDHYWYVFAFHVESGGKLSLYKYVRIY